MLVNTGSGKKYSTYLVFNPPLIELYSGKLYITSRLQRDFIPSIVSHSDIYLEIDKFFSIKTYKLLINNYKNFYIKLVNMTI